MASAVGHGSANWSTTAGNKTNTQSTLSGRLIIAICANSGRTTAQPPTFSDNNGGTYSQHATAATKATNVDSMWIFVRDSLVPNDNSTIYTMTQTGDTGGGFALWSVSGMTRTGLAAIRQVGKQDNQAAGTPSITLGAALLTTNPSVGAVFTGTNGSANSAPPTGWAENSDIGYNTPPSGLESIHRSSGSTLTTVPWTAATPSAFCSIFVELDASGYETSPHSWQYPQLLAH